MTPSKTIALDCDGVLLDYSLAYGNAWWRAFGEHPTLQSPNSYWPINRWGVPRLSGQMLEQFRTSFDDEFWSTIPAVEGALDACHQLVKAGYELVCVTALEELNLNARKHNLKNLGFPISEVIATDSMQSDVSPKASVLNQLKPVAFVDDYAPYLVGVSREIHKALILRDPIGSPNVGEALLHADSTHTNLRDFGEGWCKRL
jgi:phosphoglycolate phosphatase-like HAD superfamily hydrolase